MEDLLELKSGCLEIFYLLWLWSKSCVQTSSFSVKVVGDAGYVGDEYQAWSSRESSKQKRKKGAVLSFRHHSFKGLLKNVMNPLRQMV